MCSLVLADGAHLLAKDPIILYFAQRESMVLILLCQRILGVAARCNFDEQISKSYIFLS